ncbi:serine recombinase [Gordonia sp. CNJ-863]|uniref:recombinase family protein n=1 Tax=Gordonia sp. CNJ-863 TaxID=1904963 RepID=UPI0009672C8C|nr:recombinase family protein [Gordonia sp. CNJ-863]OLT50839.1 serine recombinase [Gordonia sp. CNJ-863]
MPISPTRKAAIYVRISLDRTGERLGVERQLEDCRALAERLGWTVAATYDDNDLSAYSGKTRPGFEALLDAIKRDEVNAVVCWHPDRLYRKLSDLVRLLDVADGVAIRTVTAGDLDLSTSSGRMMASILGSVSAAEVEHKSERQRRAFSQMAKLGKPKWRRAFGYLDDTHQPDPTTAPLVAQAYASILAGGSISDIVRQWNSAGLYGLTGKPWTPTTMSLFLRNPRNAGLRAHRGEIVGPGTWPGLIAEDTWRAAQTILTAPGRGPGRKSVRRHLLTGMLTCGKCGGDQMAGKQTLDKAIVYGCKQCHGVSIRAEYIEPFVYELIAGRLAMPDAVTLLEVEQDEADVEALRTQRATLLARLDDIADERADGLLTGAQAKRATDRITEQIRSLEVQAHDAEKVRVFDGLPLGTDDVVAAVESLSPDRLRAILGVLAEVVIAPVGKGHRGTDGVRFDPKRIQVVWK